MTIREIKIEDCKNLSALSLYVWLHTYANKGIRDKISKFVLSNFTPTTFQGIILNSFKRGFVVIINQHTIGLVVVDLNSQFKNSPEYGYEIQTLYVHPSFQKNGVGKSMLNFLKENIGEKSWLTTWTHNYNAISFYEKNGYNKVGTSDFNLFNEVHENHVLSNNT